ncbi:ankyrin and armadillo repeat-containing protein isoform X2 [Microcaecilia unicolor]|uniref:Ankyrin and armadillo repeat-containing protein-like isoform X2 n=1 Tax=Microcaecilia unicolor TaxID=1415580 RepID=A0A6P7Y5Q5_9AMPH|nr:ankyrin and armadillo repeat-containing protein-like isoform X2 [Microcaecilia unicolor]
MDDLDENGWAPIHHAAVKNHVTSIERIFETSGTQQLERNTADGHGNTPLLLAVSRASRSTVEILVKLGADVAAVNSEHHGVVEICALQGHMDLLQFFINMKSQKLNVYRKLITWLDFSNEKEALSAGLAISSLTKKTLQAARFVDEGLVPTLLHVLEKNIGDNVKEQALHVLNIIQDRNVKGQIRQHNGFQILVSLVSKGSKQLLFGLLRLLSEIVSEKEYAEALYSANAMPALVRVVVSGDESKSLDNGNREEILTSAARILGLMAEASEDCKEALGKQKGFLSVLVQMFKEFKSKNLLISWSEAVGRVVANHQINQNAFVDKNGIVPLIQLIKSKHKDLQMCALKTLHRLVEGNSHVQKIFWEFNGIITLLLLLKRSRTQPLQETIADTIWALAGAKAEDRRTMAAKIAYCPHHRSQKAVINSRGLRFLAALMIHSHCEVIQVEAAYALAAVVLGNRESMEMLFESKGFDYTHVLRLLESSQEEVRLLAGATLATFAFNNVNQQLEIVESGGVRWQNFLPFLQSGKEIHKVHAAFQSVVLSRIILDNDPSDTCATGLRILVDTLEQATSDGILAVAADSVARLAHTRAGIAAALVSIDIVNVLCHLLSSASREVQGCAAIALSYLSFNHLAERQLLKRCRETPHFMEKLLYYSRRHRISSTFLERWKHLEALGLPPIRISASPDHHPDLQPSVKIYEPRIRHHQNQHKEVLPPLCNRTIFKPATSSLVYRVTYPITVQDRSKEG